MQSRRKIVVIALAVVLSLFFLGSVALVVLKFIHFTDAEAVLKGDKNRLECFVLLKSSVSVKRRQEYLF